VRPQLHRWAYAPPSTAAPRGRSLARPSGDECIMTLRSGPDDLLEGPSAQEENDELQPDMRLLPSFT